MATETALGSLNSKTAVGRRTEELRRDIEAASGWRVPLRSRNFAWALVTWGLFVLVVGGAAAYTREQVRVAPGRVALASRATGVAFEVIDEAATAQARSTARAATPRVYVLQRGVLEELRAGLEGLPQVAQGADGPEQVEATIRQQFGLTGPTLAALKGQVRDGAVSGAWTRAVDELMDGLRRTPVLARETYQVEAQALSKQAELRDGEGRAVRVASSLAVNVESPRLADDLRPLVRMAGFPAGLEEVVLSRLASAPRPTYVFDAAATAEAQDRAAGAVLAQRVRYPAGELIYRRGDVLTPTQVSVAGTALERELADAGPLKRWGRRAAVAGVIGAVAAAILGYTVLFVPRVRRNPARMGAVAGLLGVLTLVTCAGMVAQPGLWALWVTAPPVFASMLLCIAYGQRTALAYGALHGVLLCAALDLGVGPLATVIAGVGAAVWRLREIRDRDALIKAGVMVTLALAGATLLTGLAETPLSGRGVTQALTDAGWAGFSGLLTAAVTLFILPTLEQGLGLTTGLTLIELRDPKQPLLRQLQQRAPGTYNHSLTLAALGEAAAEEIGADGLLTYVGALYHDIGKMNKPDYFVENQSPGFNRHDKLSPAMSLLVIVGHVKDGLELAREFGLPRTLWHFIESHHGTTLVEYFYHRARRQAEAASFAAGGGAVGADAPQPPSELEYRYPGPKPRTKEAAIIMICDAVESAARAMADPTPSRIDALVRAIATKRLMDGQFDECDLTLRELNTIVESVSRTLASIYHGRIAYPGGTPETPRTAAPATAGGPGTTQVITPARTNPAGVAALTTPVRGAGGAPVKADPRA